MSRYSELAERLEEDRVAVTTLDEAAAALRELETENLRLTQDLSAGGWDQHSKDARIAELEAEVKRLTKQRDRLLENRAMLLNESERLEDALIRYGQHEQGCRFGEVRPDAECTCGLEAAIND